MGMWTTLRVAPTCPHSHSLDYDISPLHRQPEGFPNCKQGNRPGLMRNAKRPERLPAVIEAPTAATIPGPSSELLYNPFAATMVV
jgi:hypothetical protein